MRSSGTSTGAWPCSHHRGDPGARVGASLTIRTAERRLRLAVGVFLALVALVYFITETRALLEQLRG